jgi:hypothetical protein
MSRVHQGSGIDDWDVQERAARAHAEDRSPKTSAAVADKH